MSFCGGVGVWVGGVCTVILMSNPNAVEVELVLRLSRDFENNYNMDNNINNNILSITDPISRKL